MIRNRFINPYLKDRRLPEVISAITAMAVYPFYKQTAPEWSNRITGSANRADHWRAVFQEHPEFFRRAETSDDFSLVWRRQLPRDYDIRTLAQVAGDHEVERSGRNPIGRRPLEPAEVTELIGVAVKLHYRALEQHKARGWWIPIFAALLAFAGALLGAWIGR